MTIKPVLQSYWESFEFSIKENFKTILYFGESDKNLFQPILSLIPRCPTIIQYGYLYNCSWTIKGEKVETVTDIIVLVRVPKKSRRYKKAFLSDQCNEIEKTIEWQRLEISSRKLEIPRKHFM